jgi:serine/threonine-protein kinase RsbW
MLYLSSNPKNISEVEIFVKRLAERFEIKADIYPNILISLTEAVNNAMVHGNHNDESKVVRIMCSKQDNTLSFTVSDEGSGFDPKVVPDPTTPENVVKIGGRGVFLMKSLCDKIRYCDNGSTVEMHFRL